MHKIHYHIQELWTTHLNFKYSKCDLNERPRYGNAVLNVSAKKFTTHVELTQKYKTN